MNRLKLVLPSPEYKEKLLDYKDVRTSFRRMCEFKIDNYCNNFY
ncbi:hypothetical protein [Clostridium sp. JNZ J1-5]